MKCNKVLILVLVALPLMCLSAVAQDGNGFTCTVAKVAGTWGYSETGTIVIIEPSTKEVLRQVPYASVGSFTIDSDGNVSGARTASQGGDIISAAIKGIATVNSDCTGTLSLSFYDPGTKASLGAIVKSVIYVNGATEAKMIVPIGPVPFPPYTAGLVLTTEAKKVSPSGVSGN
jgi:hypothetical protein